MLTNLTEIKYNEVIENSFVIIRWPHVASNQVQKWAVAAPVGFGGYKGTITPAFHYISSVAQAFVFQTCTKGLVLEID